MPDVIRPAFLWVPPGAVGSLGDEAADLAEQLDQDVREEERIALRALMPVKANGMPAGLESGIIAGRQQIKTWAMRQALIHDGWVTKVGRCMWSAHRTKTSDDTFEELTSLVESFDWLRKRVRRVYSGNGNHKIVFADKLTTYPTMGATGRQKTDRTIEFGARENGPTGRGRTKIDRLTLDEWLMGTSAMKGAQVPMMGAAANRYIRYGSSPGLVSSESLRALRQRGRRGVVDPEHGDPSLSWVEWTSERVRLVADPRGGPPRMERILPQCADPQCTHIAGIAQGCCLDDIDIIRSACPAYGTARLSEEFVTQERLTLPPIEYARERAGIWEDPPTADGADDVLTGWDDAKSGRAPSGGLALGVDVSADSRSAAIVACGGRALEVVDYRKGAGTAWVPGRVAELRERHKVTAVGLIGGRSPALPLAKDIPGCTVLTDGEAAQASVAFARDVNEGRLSHRGQAALDIAVTSAARQLSGDGWRWSRRLSRADISPLLAAVVAAHLDGLPVEVVDRSTEALLTSFG